MCGIAGFIAPNGRDSADGLRRLTSWMAATLAHRGPDGEGTWVDEAVQIGVGHRRLAILDLSEEGTQPMTSADGRWIVTFNGEIYNHMELRSRLAAEGATFRGSSDTEVLVEAVARWGPVEAITQSVGMFAVALWDRAERRLHLFRDRLGEKPLYYGRSGGVFLFGSELKAIREHPAARFVVDPVAVGALLARGFVPGTLSIYQGIRKLPPGSWLVVDAQGAHGQPEPYWSLSEVAARSAARPFRGSLTEAADALESLLRRSIRGQMMADVPLGAFLSGGIDSATIVALMQDESVRPIRTFTVAVDDPALNEADHARAVARHLGTEHTELRVTADEALDLVPTLPDMFDEPMADYSQIPTHLIARLTRRHVTVSLSGDGGDELFGGYNTYRWSLSAWRRLRWIPRPVRRAVAAASTAAPKTLVSLAQATRHPTLGHRAQRAIELIAAPSAEELFIGLARQWPSGDEPLRGRMLPRPDLTVVPDQLRDPLSRMSFLDMRFYLPDDVLVKVDRATMAVSLESRAPLLDHRLVEFAWSLPPEMKLAGGRSKRVLREVLYRYVPRSLTDQPKRGFAIPMAAWLRGPLRPWAEELLSPARLNAHGLLDTALVQKRWAEHLSGARDWKSLLWTVLSLQTWLDHNRHPNPHERAHP